MVHFTAPAFLETPPPPAGASTPDQAMHDRVATLPDGAGAVHAACPRFVLPPNRSTPVGRPCSRSAAAHPSRRVRRV